MLSFIVATQGTTNYVLERGNGTDYYLHQQQTSQQHWRFKTPKEFAYETGFYAQYTRYIRLSGPEDELWTPERPASVSGSGKEDAAAGCRPAGSAASVLYLQVSCINIIQY